MFELIQRFLKYTGIHPETFGRLTVNDPNLMYKLERGDELDDEAERMVLTFMQNYEDDRA
jgi:hypothetical protein